MGKLSELVWLLYQSSSELKEYIETDNIKNELSIEMQVQLKIVATDVFYKLSKLKNIVEQDVNIVERAKKLNISEETK